MAFRILDQAPQYLTLTGEVLAGGSLTFSQSGTSTPMDTYNGPDLGTANANPVQLDSAGRASTDIWGSGSYRMVAKDASGVSQWTRDNVQADSPLPDPSGQTDKFIKSDGTEYVLTPISQVPDTTGITNGWVVTKTSGGVAWAAGIDPANGLNGSGSTLTDFVLENVRDKVQTITAAATTTIDFSLGGVILLNQAVNITTLDLTGAPTDGSCATLTIHRVKDSSGTARTIAWPSSVQWPGGTAPTLTATASGHDVIAMQCYDGTNWWATSSLALS